MRLLAKVIEEFYRELVVWDAWVRILESRERDNQEEDL